MNQSDRDLITRLRQIGRDPEIELYRTQLRRWLMGDTLGGQVAALLTDYIWCIRNNSLSIDPSLEIVFLSRTRYRDRGNELDRLQAQALIQPIAAIVGSEFTVRAHGTRLYLTANNGQQAAVDQLFSEIATADQLSPKRSNHEQSRHLLL